MNDIRLIGLIVIIVLFLIGLLFAKVLAFSFAWILWPFGIILILWGIFCLFVSAMVIG